MARPKKERKEEVEAIFNNLKYCSATELKEVINRATKLLDGAKRAEIQAKEKAIEKLNKELEELRK
ncbi:MAG: hypothetical protein K2G41_04005 [Duncaniella sp.]|uniref:hypothetical protein n=1 Tax=Duncaniella sp. TaxID=2518496 RepID=UPI0023CCA49A|nr:hypothetical protein [Duncaniella sp.]MDE6089847.1 hypothetical protein [Duncaniella sp.]